MQEMSVQAAVPGGQQMQVNVVQRLLSTGPQPAEARALNCGHPAQAAGQSHLKPLPVGDANTLTRAVRACRGRLRCSVQVRTGPPSPSTAAPTPCSCSINGARPINHCQSRRTPKQTAAGYGQELQAEVVKNPSNLVFGSDGCLYVACFTLDHVVR